MNRTKCTATDKPSAQGEVNRVARLVNRGKTEGPRPPSVVSGSHRGQGGGGKRTTRGCAPPGPVQAIPYRLSFRNSVFR